MRFFPGVLMRKFFCLGFLLLSGCQSGSLHAPDKAAALPPETAVAPAASAKPQPLPARPVSGVYVSEFRHRREDGKGRLKNEFGKFSYWVDEISPGIARVRYEGGATYASDGMFGGSDSAWIKVRGQAQLKQGVWVLQTTEGGTCEVRFQVDGQSLKHLSAICEQAGQYGHYAWPIANSQLKLQRSLKATESNELRLLRKPR